ncbi:hypothetical protein SEA_CICADA_62 [Microbacterium phage Cicada]|nr:hypothetical protein SEA_CICADA_62 [Microbacterium phage Cicada]
MTRGRSRGRRVSTSVLTQFPWSSSWEAGIWDYYGTLTAVVPDVWTGTEVVRKFDASFITVPGGRKVLRVVNERPPWHR